MELKINLYHYLYMKVYLTQYKAKSSYSDVNFNVCIALSLAILFNFIMLCIISTKLFGYSPMNGAGKFLYGVSAVSLFLLNYMYFSYKERYKAILKKFNFEQEVVKPGCDYPGVIYIWGSLILLIIAGLAL